MDFINTSITMETTTFDMNNIITHLYEQSHIYGILIGMYFVYLQINNKIDEYIKNDTEFKTELNTKLDEFNINYKNLITDFNTLKNNEIFSKNYEQLKSELISDYARNISDLNVKIDDHIKRCEEKINNDFIANYEQFKLELVKEHRELNLKFDEHIGKYNKHLEDYDEFGEAYDNHVNTYETFMKEYAEFKNSLSTKSGRKSKTTQSSVSSL